MNLSHRTAMDWIHRERDGRLEKEARQKLEQHLAACSQCRSAAALARRLELPGEIHPLLESARRMNDRQMVEAVLRGRRRKQLLWQPLKGLAWAGALVVLVLLLSWSIQSLLPTAGGQPASSGASPAPLVLPELAGEPEQGLEAAPISQTGVVPWESMEWVYQNFYLVGLVPLILVGLSGIFLGTRQADITWLAFLLGSLAFGVGFLFWGIGKGTHGNGLYILLAIPFLAAALGMLVVHIWSTPRLWTRWVLFLLLVWVGGLVLLVVGPWYGHTWDEVFARSGFLLILGIGLLPAFLWQAWGWRGNWRWIFPLVFLISLFGMAASILGYFSSLTGEVPWLGVMAGLGMLLWPAASLVAAARLLFTWLSERRSSPKIRLMLLGAAAVALLFATLVIQVRLMAIQNSVSEDALVGIFLLLLADITALVVCVAMAWRLQGGRLWAAIGMVVIFAAAVIPAAFVPDEMAGQVTEQRAAQIDGAILHFHDETGRYPASLAELSPRYLLLIPQPITHWQSTWCYDGGTDYYRLGYATPVHFAYPGEIEAHLAASAGVLPSLSMPCEAELQKIKDRYR